MWTKDDEEMLTALQVLQNSIRTNSTPRNSLLGLTVCGVTISPDKYSFVLLPCGNISITLQLFSGEI